MPVGSLLVDIPFQEDTGQVPRRDSLCIARPQGHLKFRGERLLFHVSITASLRDPEM